jgi:hypothetical protein
MLIPLTVTLVAVALFFRETHRPSTTTGVDFAASFYNIFAVFRPTRIRILYLANFAFYLGSLRDLVVKLGIERGTRQRSREQSGASSFR